eukprot:CAMPEP_0113487114 /NCGR_PEP_ID=MMETSP0014_2-20120614/25343_1 /TAXON_ID=2857 /ORGANISM="Nitzschia sp." /LENGTH=148 /DNA_ID=CAMNT_0000380803 /DNA_START=1796 /DNA_END=2243 /DNA_ORIENTATION=- /assembly_acc=CAM_ASM_000159
MIDRNSSKPDDACSSSSYLDDEDDRALIPPKNSAKASSSSTTVTSTQWPVPLGQNLVVVAAKPLVAASPSETTEVPDIIHVSHILQYKQTQSTLNLKDLKEGVVVIKIHNGESNQLSSILISRNGLFTKIWIHESSHNNERFRFRMGN